MLQHLVILLDDMATAYCHAPNPNTESRPMPLDTLKRGILFGMKENLMIHFVYPEQCLPDGYEEAIESIDHFKIKPCHAHKADEADVLVCASVDELERLPAGDIAVLTASKHTFFTQTQRIAHKLPELQRLNVLLSDIETFSENDFAVYDKALDVLAGAIKEAYKNGKTPQTNLLTDRILLDKMNNCNAGTGTITLAPDGRFYLCPAYYYSHTGCSGSLEKGIQVKNPQLLRLDHAPLCRKCDAWHCNRCVWLNEKTTWDANTPSRQQCVIAHTERNASRRLLTTLQQYGFFTGKRIEPTAYLDPFDARERY